MKKLNKWISLLLCAVILVGLLPTGVWAVDTAPAGEAEDQSATATEIASTTTTTTYYVLTDSLTDGEDYLICNRNTTGSGVLLANGGNNDAVAKTVEIKYDGERGTYIEAADVDSIWNVNVSGNEYRFANNSEYLDYADNYSWSGVTYTLEVNSSCYWTYSNNRLYVSIGWRNPVDYYLYHNNGWGISTSTSNSNVYFYQKTNKDTPTTVSKEVTYSLAASDISYVYPESGAYTTVITVAISPNDGKFITGGTYSYKLVSGSDDIISSIDNGVITFNGKAGEAKVRVYYTFEDDAGVSHTIWDTITVVAEAVETPDPSETTTPSETTDPTETTAPSESTDPDTGDVWALELWARQVDDSGNVLSSELITAPIVIKNVANGQSYTNIWAVITRDGEDIGTLTEEQLKNLTFISSDESIATVNKATGLVTFQGKEGTVRITAVYEYAEGKSVTDTVVFSVATDGFYVPEDGTNDFPEYPNEGSVRFDKTATAVGNFGETGIVKVELSMTGVPYTTGNEIDVVVMLDMTGSMSTNGMIAAEEATVAFVELIVKNEDGTYNDNRVAVYAFNSGSSSPYELVSLGTIKSDSELSTASTAIRTASDKKASGGTPFDEAAKKCYDVLQAAKTDGTGNDRQQFCVFMSDGGPTTYYGSDEKTYYGGNSNSGDVKLTECMTGYSSSTASSWKFTLPTEYYTDQMKANGVTVYTVGLLLQTKPSNPAPYSSMTNSTYDSDTDSLTTIGSHYYFTSSILKQMATDETKYIDIFNVDKVDNAVSKFESIAQSILEAATNVVVQDKIADEFTMIFDLPNEVTSDATGTEDFYIELMDYALVPVYDTDGTTIIDYKRGTGSGLSKIYLGVSNGSYYAASDTSGTAYTTPVFAAKTEDQKAYWTTNNNGGVSVTVGGTTYYFTSDGNGTHNMSEGAMLSGTSNDNIRIATPYYVYDASTKMLVWTTEKLHSSELALSYFLYLENSAGVDADEQIAAGTYETNDYAYLQYENFQNTPCEQEFPVPQITWNGAQVSYVFYLVNEQGQPVNRAGRVVPFSEAVYVTDVYMRSVVWNSLERVASLEADIIAAELLPSVYQLYDTSAEYNIHVFEDENGQNLNNHFVIVGEKSTNTTYVFNTKAGDKYSLPGAYAATKSYKCKVYIDGATVSGNTITLPDTINVTGQVAFEEEPTGADLTVKTTDGWYAYYIDDQDKVYTIAQMNNATIVAPGFDFANTTVAFAVVWKPGLKEDTVVIDYGLDVEFDVVANDIMVDSYVGLMTTAPSGVAINKGTFAEDDIFVDRIETDMYVAYMLSNSTVRFELKDATGMQLSEPIVFYYVANGSYYDDGVLNTGYMYSSVTVIPASTVYYEENFVSFGAAGSEITTDNGTFISEGWEGGTVIAELQDTDRPGVSSNMGTGYDADNLYGYDSHYLECNTYSNGAAKKVTVNADTFATATFTFTGTGFDLIGVTSHLTGTVTAKVRNDDTGFDEQIIFVDTHYGASYQEVDVIKKDDNGNPVLDSEGKPVYEKVQKLLSDASKTGTLYQVPIVTARELTYGKYTVTITVSYNEQYDHNKNGSNEFYLDAVRIYDPTGVVAGAKTNQTVMDAYIADDEWAPTFEEIRNVLLTFYGSGSMADGATIQNFIDGNPVNTSVEDYKNYGPNNELYLGYEQNLVIDVDDTFVNNQNVADIQIGLKSANENNLQVKIYNLVNGNESNVKVISINTASDLFYSILDHYTGVVVIENITEGTVLSITNVKSTLKQTVSQTVNDNDNAGGNEVLSDSTDEQEPSVVWTTLAKFYIDVVIAVAGVFSDIEAILNAVYAVATTVI